MLFFNYCTASGMEQRKPQYLEYDPLVLHIRLIAFQGDWGNASGDHVSQKYSGDSSQALRKLSKRGLCAEEHHFTKKQLFNSYCSYNLVGVIF